MHQQTALLAACFSLAMLASDHGAAQSGGYAPGGSGGQGSAQAGSGRQGSGRQGSAQQGSAQQGSAPNGSHTAPGGSGYGPVGSGSLAASAELALRGFCPVCLVEMKQWVVGDARYTAVYDGKAYRFPDARRRQIFQASPAKYTPALGGDNIVRYAKSGDRVPGELAYGVTHRGRTFFVGSESERQEFLGNPTRFANADLALGGECVVCRVNMNQAMPGDVALTATYRGVRYQFAGADQMKAFAATPERFANAAAAMRPKLDQGSGGGGSSSQGSGSQGSGDGSGTSSNPSRTAPNQGGSGSGGSGSGY